MTNYYSKIEEAATRRERERCVDICEGIFAGLTDSEARRAVGLVRDRITFNAKVPSASKAGTP